jgi:PAS domain-containing protein
MQRSPIHTAPTRQVVAAALVLLVLGALGAIQAGFAGSDFMFDLEQVQPALARAQPVVDPTPTPRLARRIYLVIIDGLRADRSYELPYLDELRRRGVDLEVTSHYPTWSRPNYVSILTGVPPSASGVRTNHHATPVLLDSLMDRAHAAGLRVAVATDYDNLPRLFLRRRGDLHKPRALVEPIHLDPEDPVFSETREPVAIAGPDADLVSPFDDARYAPWPGGFAEAGAALVADRAELVVLLVGAVDLAGHSSGATSPKYREAALAADHALALALANIDLTKDAVVITADHGHTDRGGHGGIEPEVRMVPLVLAGAGVEPGAAVYDGRLIDVAPTVAALLGIPAPGHGLGRTLAELLTLDRDAAAARASADRTRVGINQRIVELAEVRADGDVLEHRAMRIALVVGGALFGTVLAVLLIIRRVLRFDVRAILVSVPAFFVVYTGLIALVGQRFSPSFLPAQGNLASTLALYGGAAMLVQLLASMWVLRSYRTLGERLAAANGIAWFGLTLSMFTAGMIWAFFPPPFVTVPSPTWLVVIPAVEVAVACAAVNVALTLFVEVAIFVQRAWQREHVALD